MTAVMRLVALASGLVALSCAPLTEACTPSPVVQNTWQYRATQEAPPGPVLTGTLLITGRSCGDFDGLLDVIETDGGVSRRIAGPVSGVMLDSVTARFSVTIGTMEREHIARFTADSVAGSWVEHGASSATYGRFSGWRQAAP